MRMLRISWDILFPKPGTKPEIHPYCGLWSPTLPNPAVEKEDSIVQHNFNSNRSLGRFNSIYMDFIFIRLELLSFPQDLITKNEIHWPVNTNILVLITWIPQIAHRNVHHSLLPSRWINHSWIRSHWESCLQAKDTSHCDLKVLLCGSTPGPAWNNFARLEFLYMYSVRECQWLPLNPLNPLIKFFPHG